MTGRMKRNPIRNILQKKHEEEMWEEANQDRLVFRYRLDYPKSDDKSHLPGTFTSRNIRCGPKGLITEIIETKPIYIERIG